MPMEGIYRAFWKLVPNSLLSLNVVGKGLLWYIATDKDPPIPKIFTQSSAHFESNFRENN